MIDNNLAHARAVSQPVKVPKLEMKGGRQLRRPATVQW